MATYNLPKNGKEAADLLLLCEFGDDYIAELENLIVIRHGNAFTFTDDPDEHEGDPPEVTFQFVKVIEK